MTDGDLFDERTRVVHIFVDGRKVAPDAPAPAGGRGRGRGGVDVDVDHLDDGRR